MDARIRYETNELRLLFEVSQALEGASELSERLAAVLALLARDTGMMRGALCLLLPGPTENLAEAFHGLKGPELHSLRCATQGSVMSQVVSSGQSAAVSKSSGQPVFLGKSEAWDLAKEELSFLCVPILVDVRPMGALLVDRLFADSVSLAEDLRLAHVFASLIARALRIRREFQSIHSAVLEENRRLRNLARGPLNTGGMIGSSAPIRALLEEVAQVTGTSATVLIRGENGTGKELVAGIIHANSSRSGGPFIKVNCAALPEGLVESELFGHERGAFTGAVGLRKGRFEMAHGGTLFLDEVGDMTLTTQAKLLRVIQEKEFERVGGAETIRVDARLIAATNRDLESMVGQGTFRQDLYYRLSVFPLILPPLRERRSDIMALVTHFVDQVSAANRKKVVRLTQEATALLLRYDWPGNIRELENVVERAVILCGLDGVIGAQHLPPWLQSAPPAALSRETDDTAPVPLAPGPAFGPEQPDATLDEALAALEERLIVQALEVEGGTMSRAARRLGITERVMGLRMARYGLDYRHFRKKNGLA